MREKFTFKSDIDGLRIYALRYCPEGEVKGIVQIVHGMCEHKERYDALMNYLADKGYICVILSIGVITILKRMVKSAI